jgi:PAS domain S-box-containing protein
VPPEGGEPMHFLSSGEPRFDAQGQFLGYWGVVRDVTAEHRAQQALARSQALLTQVVSMSPDLIALSEVPSGRFVMVNASFTRLLGYPSAEVVGRTALELGVWRSPTERDRLAQMVGEHGVLREMLIELVARDDHLVPLMVTGAQLHSGGQDYALITGRDVSESTRARLEREAILANASVGIAFTRGHRLELVNAHFEQMFGWAPGTLVGQSGRVLWPDDAAHEAVRSQIAPRLARGEAVDVEDTGQRRDGSTLRMRLRAKAIDPSQPATSGTIWIAEDVTDARRAEQELARARDAAEAANRAKSTFLANTSHEIRTPLNGLTGLARLARQPGLPPERLRQYLDQIGESADQLSTIISDILDLSKIEAGKLEVALAPFDLRDLLERLQQAYGALATSQGLAFEADIGAGLPQFVQGDALRVRQILSNFLHNALKFTAEGGIRLGARALPGGRVRLEVQDTGPGIDTATQARLFKPFTQADESTTRRYGGTGLGLSICRELAGLMGGEVGVRSLPGQGSCFHAELPLPEATEGASAEAAGPVDSARLATLRVLLVEDNAVNMLIGVALLEEWGVQVTQALDGAQALACVAAQTAAGRPFDLVLMDLQMPGMSGYEATRQLRLQHSADQLPVIALTAAALVSERERAVATGMTDFITKPIDPDLLQAALLRATARLSRA